MKKRILALFLAILMVLSIFPAPTFAVDVTNAPSTQSERLAKITSIFPVLWKDPTNNDPALQVSPPGGALPVYVKIVDEHKYSDTLTLYKLDAIDGETWPEEYDAYRWMESSKLSICCDKCGEFGCKLSHENWCEICKKDDCGIDHSDPSDPVDPELPTISGTVTDSNGNFVTDANGEPLVITVTGDLPAGAIVSASIPAVEGLGEGKGIFDIKVLVPGEDGKMVEWQPIDDNKTVTLSIPVDTDTEFVDVYHFIDYAPVLENDDVIRYYPSEYISTNLLAQLESSVAASKHEGFVPAEVSFNVNVIGSAVQFETNSFSIFYYNDGAYTDNQTGNSTSSRLQFTSLNDENGKYYFVTRDTQIYVDTSIWGRLLSSIGLYKPVWSYDESVYTMQTEDSFNAIFSVVNDDDAEVYTNNPINFVLKGSLFGSEAANVTINFIVMPELTLNFESNVPGHNLGIASESGIFMGNTDDTPTSNTQANEWIAAGKYPALNHTLDTPTAPAGYKLSEDYAWYVKHEPSKIFKAGQEIKLSNSTLEVKTDDGSSQYTVTLVANFVPEEHTITWDNQGVTLTTTYKTGEEISIPSPPVREGYIFTGWLVSSDDNSQNWTSQYSIVSGGSTLSDMYGDVTLTAGWTEASGISYQVEHHFQNVAQTGYVVDPVVDTLYGTTGQETKAASVQRTVPGFTVERVEEKIIVGDGSTVVAIYYKRNIVTITFDTNGGSSVASISGVYGTSISAPTPPTKQYYVFSGWYSADDTAANYQFVTMPATDLTLYARWNVQKTTVTFQEENGNVLYVINGDAGTPFEWPKDPTKAGYKFDGWDKTPEALPVIPEGGATVTASWKLITYRISFQEKNGSSTTDVPEVTPNPQQFTIEDNSGATLPTPTRVGYTFGGWYADADCTGQPYDALSLATELLTQNTSTTVQKTVYAKWTTNAHYVFYTGESITESSTKFAYGATVTVDAPPTRENYDFVVWNVTGLTGVTTLQAGETFTMPDNAVTLTAEWELALADLTVKVSGNRDADQSYVFAVYRGTDNNKTFVMNVVIPAGKTSVTIKDLPVDNYTVTPVSGWAWRLNTDEQQVELNGDQTVEFKWTLIDRLIYWLNGYSYNKRGG